jgi:hypothetical protein
MRALNKAQKWQRTWILQDVLPCSVFAARQNVPEAPGRGAPNKRPVCATRTSSARRAEHPRSYGTAGAQLVKFVVCRGKLG